MEMIINYWQVILGMLLGAVFFTFICFLHWYQDFKSNVVNWISRNVFRNSYSSNLHADQLLMTATSILLWLSILLFGVGLLFIF